MKKFSVLILFLQLFLSTKAQHFYNDYNRYGYLFGNDSAVFIQENYVGAYADYSLNATGVTNGFFLKFLNGEYIDNKDKSNIEKRLWRVNRYGYQLNLNISGKARIDSSLAILAGISGRQQNSAKFSDEMFTLVFRGNKGFAGQTADLDPFQFTSIDYQSYSLGIDKLLLQNKLHVWFGLSGVRGGNIRYAKADKLKLYTEENGSYIEADADFEFRLSDGSPGLFSKMNGLGASVYMGLDYQVGKSVFGISVSDLGFIKFDPLKTYDANSTLRFEGKEIENVLSFNDTLFKSYNADTLATESGIKISQKKYLYKLPTFIRLTYVYNLSPKIALVNSLEFLSYVGALPEISLKPVYTLSDNFFVSSTISFGQFGAFDLEFGLAAKLKSGLSGFFNITGAEFLLAKNKTSGQGINLGIYKAF